MRTGAWGPILVPGLLLVVAGLGGSSGAVAQTVQGRVVDAFTGAPLPAVELALLAADAGTAARTVTRPGGAFVLEAPGPGELRLEARALGYFPLEAGPFPLVAGETLEVTLRLEPDPVELDAGVRARIRAERVDAYLEDEGFYDRRMARSGTFLGPQELGDRPWIDLGHLFQRVPFARVDRRFGSGDRILLSSRFGGDCQPRVWVDGMPAPPGPLDHLVRVDDVLALEVYRGEAGTPLEWGGGFNTCGVVLIWSRWAAGVAPRAGRR